MILAQHGNCFTYQPQNRAQNYNIFLINEEITPIYQRFLQIIVIFVG